MPPMKHRIAGIMPIIVNELNTPPNMEIHPPLFKEAVKVKIAPTIETVPLKIIRRKNGKNWIFNVKKPKAILNDPPMPSQRAAKCMLRITAFSTSF
ncbi:MAG: hypothetical protein H3Z54_06845 [archaeon]|nr:hypothetical protein [archaeon]